MNKDLSSISLSGLKRPILRFLNRYHVVLFIVFVVGALIMVMFQLNTIIQDSSASNATTPAPAVGFDEQTIEEISALRDRSQSGGSLDLSGRSNPFVE